MPFACGQSAVADPAVDLHVDGWGSAVPCGPIAGREPTRRGEHGPGGARHRARQLVEDEASVLGGTTRLAQA